jgi:hypothetical protein
MGGGGYKERVKEENMVEMLCTDVWKWEEETCW